MINAGTNQHLEKIWSNLTEQEPCYLKNCSSMQISYFLQNHLSWMYRVLLQICQLCSCTYCTWLVIFTWFLLGSCIIITILSILSNSSENTSPSEDCKTELLHESCSKKELYLELLHGLSYQIHPSFTPNTISATHSWVENCRSVGESVSGVLPVPPNLPIFISPWQGRFLIHLFMQLLWYIMFFAHMPPVSFRNMSLIWI